MQARAEQAFRLERNAVELDIAGEQLRAGIAGLVRHDQQRNVDGIAVARPVTILLAEKTLVGKHRRFADGGQHD